MHCLLWLSTAVISAQFLSSESTAQDQPSLHKVNSPDERWALSKGTAREMARKGEEGMMARADERECGRTWQESEEKGEGPVATAADVVCEASHNVALDPRSAKRGGNRGLRLKY